MLLNVLKDLWLLSIVISKPFLLCDFNLLKSKSSYIRKSRGNTNLIHRMTIYKVHATAGKRNTAQHFIQIHSKRLMSMTSLLRHNSKIAETLRTDRMALYTYRFLSSSLSNSAYPSFHPLVYIKQGCACVCLCVPLSPKKCYILARRG